MRVQRLPLTLPVEEYKQLETIAAEYERDPWQHARWIIRQAIRQATIENRHEIEHKAVAT
ncbi:hypothetical protein BH23CHL2_BH23CHL2_15940 [soil metagenome]